MLKDFVRDYIEKRSAIEAEVGLLKDDLKALDNDFNSKIDVKAVKAALRIIKLKQSTDGNAVDEVIDILELTDSDEG